MNRIEKMIGRLWVPGRGVDDGDGDAFGVEIIREAGGRQNRRHIDGEVIGGGGDDEA